MQDTEVERTPPMSCSPGRQVKLEDALEAKKNPATKEIQGDEGRESENRACKRRDKCDLLQRYCCCSERQITPFPSRLGGATWGRLTPIKVSPHGIITKQRNTSRNVCILFLYCVSRSENQHDDDNFGSSGFFQRI